MSGAVCSARALQDVMPLWLGAPCGDLVPSKAETMGTRASPEGSSSSSYVLTCWNFGPLGKETTFNLSRLSVDGKSGCNHKAVDEKCYCHLSQQPQAVLHQPWNFKARYGPKALWNMSFGPKSLKLWDTEKRRFHGIKQPLRGR